MIHHRLRGLQKGGGAVNVSDVFATTLYTGNGSTQTITNGINLSGEGGLVWVKSRNAATDHQLFDTNRTATYELITNGLGQQAADSDTLTAFNTNGFSLGADATVNTNNNTYVAWTFRQAPRFFDVVTYTGNSGGTQAINHSLSVAPGMVIVKNASTSSDWYVWHRSATSGEYLKLNTTDADSATSAANAFGNNTTTVVPTSTQFTVGSTLSASTNTYVAYLFAHDPDGVIQCGSFTTDGSGNATVTLGWEPQFVIVKTANSAEEWQIYDTTRGWSVGGSRRLVPNATDAEIGPISVGYPNSTGFTYSGVGITNHIYMAIKKAS